MKALLLEVDFATGRRAGGVNPRDKNLPCDPVWQDTDAGREIRVVKDGNVERFRGQPGVTILEDEAAIDAAVASLQAGKPESYQIANEHLAVEHIRQKNLKLDDLAAGLAGNELAKALFDRGILGVAKIGKPKAPSAAAMKKRHLL